MVTRRVAFKLEPLSRLVNAISSDPQEHPSKPAAKKIGTDTSRLTRKHFLTYCDRMVETPNREADVFGAISHPARRRMLDLLVESDRSVSALTGRFQMSRPAVSQHLRVLLDAGLVAEQRHGRERRYRIVPEGLAPVRDWIAFYERFWDDRLLRLQKQLTKMSKE